MRDGFKTDRACVGLGGPRVKVCGLTRVCDALGARRVGADALGVVYAPGKGRHVEPHQIKAIFDRVWVPWRVVVVVDAEPRAIMGLLAKVKANAIQLCGSASPRAWEHFPFAILRRVGVDSHGAEEIARWRDVAKAFVLDHPAHRGGAGICVDRKQAALLARLAPCLLAGGLHADNVAQAVSEVSPAGVDASSKLERCLRHKDSAKVKAYVVNAIKAQRMARR